MKKWSRNASNTDFSKHFDGKSPNPPTLRIEKGHYSVSGTTTTPWPPLHHLPSHPYLPPAMRCFHRAPQVSCFLLFVRGHLLSSLLKRLGLSKAWKKVCSTPRASLFSCQAIADCQSFSYLGTCLFETKIRQICFCTCPMSKPIKEIFCSCCIPILIIRNAKLAVSAMLCQKPRFCICWFWMHMQHCHSICDIAVFMCFGHLSHLLNYFSWESLPVQSNEMVESRILWPGS